METSEAGGSSPAQRLAPRHVAVIMDGNGRWAKAHGVSRLAGHRAGTEALRRLIEGCMRLGIPYLTIYAFSTENWKRPAYEVRGLLYLLEEVISRQLDELDANGVRLIHVGWYDSVPQHLAVAIRDAVARTAGNSRLTLCVAFNYGGRGDIVRAARRLLADGVSPDDVDEALFASHLATSAVPDPDLVIRTAGEMRLSNFLLWQSAYAEFYSAPVLWPDFAQHDLIAAVDEYARRERRFGARPGERVETTDNGAGGPVAAGPNAGAAAEPRADSPDSGGPDG